MRLRYTDFGPSLAAEMLLTKDGVKVSRETLRKWMVEDGLWLSRKQRRSFHQPRLRRESYGELIQIDGSDHRWFEERGAACSPVPVRPGTADVGVRQSAFECWLILDWEDRSDSPSHARIRYG